MTFHIGQPVVVGPTKNNIYYYATIVGIEIVNEADDQQNKYLIRYLDSQFLRIVELHSWRIRPIPQEWFEDFVMARLEGRSRANYEK